MRNCGFRIIRKTLFASVRENFSAANNSGLCHCFNSNEAPAGSSGAGGLLLACGSYLWPIRSFAHSLIRSLARSILKLCCCAGRPMEAATGQPQASLQAACQAAQAKRARWSKSRGRHCARRAHRARNCSIAGEILRRQQQQQQRQQQQQLRQSLSLACECDATKPRWWTTALAGMAPVRSIIMGRE